MRDKALNTILLRKYTKIRDAGFKPKLLPKDDKNNDSAEHIIGCTHIANCHSCVLQNASLCNQFVFMWQNNNIPISQLEFLYLANRNK